MRAAIHFNFWGLRLDLPAVLLMLAFFLGGLGIIYQHIDFPDKGHAESPISPELGSKPTEEQETATLLTAEYEQPSPELEKVVERKASYSAEEQKTFKEIFDLASLDTLDSLAPSTTAVKIAPSLSANTYFLVYGTFDKLESATHQAQKLNDQGYDARLLYPNPGQSRPYRVYLFRNNDLRPVEDFQRSLKKKGYSKGMIYTQKN